MIIPKNKEFDELINDSDAFLLGIENMSINMPIYFNIDEIGLISEKLHKKKKNLFISLNKNMHNKDLKELERILTILNDLKIEGIFYYDVAVLSIVRRLKLDLKLVWSSEHLTTNYATINFWKDMKIDYTYLSAEITLDEIIEISKNTSVKLIVPIFGYLPIFASMRHTVKNYLNRFNLKDNSKINYLNLKDDYHPIVDDNLGTNIYSAYILNGYQEYLKLKNYQIDYVTLNAFDIDDEKFMKVVKMFKEGKQESEEKTEEKKDVYIVYRIDDETQTIRLQKVKNGKFSEYGISDATAYRDKYGEFTSEGNITEGSPVQIGTANQEGKLSYIQQSDQVWEQDNVGKFSIDEEKNMIVIGKTKYYYDDSLLVFLDGEQISLDTITGNDKLRVAGMDKKIISVNVTSGHGFIVLTHTDLFEGGSISIGGKHIYKIEKDMNVEIPEGTYQVTAANDGYGDTKEVTVKRNETTVLNLDEYKGEGPKLGKVKFILQQRNMEHLPESW